MPVGRWVMRTAESVTLMCWPPCPLDRYVSTRRSFSSMSTSTSSGNSGQTKTEANDVCRRAAWSNGEMRATGREILTELIRQLGFDDILDEVLATTDVTTAMMP